jgi:FkbH-like protein
LKYSQKIKRNKELFLELSSEKEYQISILSNVTVNQFSGILEYSLRKKEIKATAIIGDYDNIVQDSIKYCHSDCIIIFWEIDNLVDGFGYKSTLMSDEDLLSLENKIKADIDFVVANLKDTSLVLFNSFSPVHNSEFILDDGKVDKMASSLNRYLAKNLPNNFKLIEIDKVKSICSLKDVLDFRFYYLSKAPYTIKFFEQYCKCILPFFMSVRGKAKKVLIFDCDNTLWKGILGEDGLDGIRMSADRKAAMYEEVQYLAKYLAKSGVIIGLCSKNNREDIDQVLKSHPDMILKDEDISIKKVNWDDKAKNLHEIATELNLGLDSMVFVDDSDFEVSNIKERIPEITVLQVPKQLYKYPKMIKDSFSLFFNHSRTKEDTLKIKMYCVESKRKESHSQFKDLSSYLRSLCLKMRIFKNDFKQIPRIAQLTQKTNQFNLTTRRYTENDIKVFMENETNDVYSFELIDKFGNYGVTGVCIAGLKEQISLIDTLLLSCRVLGRDAEWQFTDYVIKELSLRGAQKVKSVFSPTLKNNQVESFWEKMGFLLMNDGIDGIKHYSLITNEYMSKKVEFIEIEGEKNDGK